MRTIDPQTLSRRQRYTLLTSTVIPRPIGWISTLDAEGRSNLAPFSFFNAVTSEPPTVMISIGRRRGGRRKDSAANLLETQEGVVHMTPRRLAEAMVVTSTEAEPDVDEFVLAELERCPSENVRPFRVEGAPIAMECKMVQHLEVGAGPVDMFLLEVVCFHIDKDVMIDDVPDPTRLQAIGRLGGAHYCETTSLLSLARPSRPGRSG